MNDDPILIIGLIIALVFIPAISMYLGRKKAKYLLLPSFLSMIIAFPMFFFVMIVPDLLVSKVLFYISMVLWTSGFFCFFIFFYIYKRNQRTS
ncbi:MAG: hypothetical protein WC152_06985 [Candidatus Izemoplasmatales bacterium]